MTHTHTLTGSPQFDGDVPVVHVWTCVKTRLPYVRLLNDDGRGEFPCSWKSLKPRIKPARFYR